MAETTTTALDVAVEYVALKLALAGVLDTLTFSSPSEVSKAMSEWVQQSPVPFPTSEEYPESLEEEFGTKLASRSLEIETEMIAAAGAFLTARAEELRELRTTTEVAA